ncbi:hypothetical protein TBLA_0A01910 [Henningerozyma blattae CBS 6284]|uniref:Uncharacterized protein n=1 Tax=Henningerozyma blattae (strain ATCC 34711 / CBS 6284 / DSM 70876 / NBRC 10599 / NRRL Y-10934 / UCD 77-7) TaxID=1071380 RepID=I2GV40_HENB6|nr:hypothetical protein TBLA_0A01910 [Tetrapisispora blattae CBS 6284]CCH57992.1 hypothetical protein TBLA_0A01910 [Tetrapisispora blattae CBS 6284]
MALFTRTLSRRQVTNQVFLTTFVVAFASVALGSALPCPAHSLDADTPVLDEKDNNINSSTQEIEKRKLRQNMITSTINEQDSSNNTLTNLNNAWFWQRK